MNKAPNGRAPISQVTFLFVSKDALSHELNAVQAAALNEDYNMKHDVFDHNDTVRCIIWTWFRYKRFKIAAPGVPCTRSC